MRRNGGAPIIHRVHDYKSQKLPPQPVDDYLAKSMVRRVVRSGAFLMVDEEGVEIGRRLRRNWEVVLRCRAEPTGPAVSRAALHADQLGGKSVHRLVVQERLVDPPAERAGVVQR